MEEKEHLTKTDYTNAAQNYRELADMLGLGKLSVADTIRKALERDEGYTEVGGVNACPGQVVLDVTKDGRIFCGNSKNPKILFESEVLWVRIEEFHGKEDGDIMYCYIDGPARHGRGNFFSPTEAEFDFYPDEESDFYETTSPLECFAESGVNQQDWEYYEVDFFRPDQMVDGKRPVPYDGTEGENKADADYSILIRAKHKPTIEEAEEWLKKDIEAFHEGGVLQVVGPCKEEEVAPFYDMTDNDNWPIFG